MKALYVAMAMMVVALTGWAADDADLTSRPGYIDFSELAADYGEPRVSVDLGSSILKLVSAMQHRDPVAEAALRNIESVRVSVYDTAGDIAAATERMAEVREILGDLDWTQIVRVREPGEKVDVYVKHGDDEIHGLTVMKVDGKEAVFVNVLGDINPAELSSVMRRVDVDVDVGL